MVKPYIFKTGIADNVIFGENCKVADSANIYKAIIGKNCFIGPWVEIQNDVIIGNNTRVHSHTLICEGMVIGKSCFIGHGVMTANSRYPSTASKEWNCEPPILGNEVIIGSNATLLPGVKIGNNAVIGAGITVLRDILDGEIYTGDS